ncbi:ribosome maturation factor RimM [Trueperella bialowiezensis]|uniref:Ribosome maturation factor RimM n=1 Tax=Trueperella bialowiezensis TaxID=312285 RepID=A0A3S4V9P4_9ACTO|nr:ribosome maturation factor RimM [Trueperella bialowiezensis]VEI12694.1 Ribosome maturation factor rimM [Trueperella bialowiezensis]
MQLTVAIIGRPQGLKGEVKLDVRTDAVEERLALGAMLETDPAEMGPVTVAKRREYKGQVFVTFEEYPDRSGAEALRGTKLVIESDEDEVEDDAWFAHELKGLEALDPEGYELGIVVGLEYMPGHDLLVVREPDGIITRVPFVKEIVTEVDLEDNCVVIDAPPGLFSPEDLVVSEETGEIKERRS